MKQPKQEIKELIAQYKSIKMAVRRRRRRILVHVNRYNNTKMRLYPIVVYKKRNSEGRGTEICLKFSSQYSSVRVFSLGNLLYK